MKTDVPNIHAHQRLTTPTGDPVDVDTELVPLVQALWDRGYATAASCQDFGEGTQGQRQLHDHPSSYGGDAFIAYHWGWAWLKMPVDDGKRYLDALLNTPFRERVTARWQPGSWRLHIPLIHDPGAGIVPAQTLQIHFPRAQTSELTEVTRAMPR